MKTTLLIPTLNEIQGMQAIYPQIDKSWVDQILVVDGGSNDGTIEYCKKNNIPIVVQEKKGLRQGYFEAWPYITGDIVITFSPDGNSLAEKIPPLVEKMKEGHDMVIVSRYKDGAKSDDDDVITSFGNWLFTRTVNLLFKAKYTDAMVMFRAFKKDIIKEMHLLEEQTYSTVERCFFTNISWEPLLSARAARMGYKIEEIPGDEPRRLGGERKLQIIRWELAYYSQFLYEFLFKKVRS